MPFKKTMIFLLSWERFWESFIVVEFYFPRIYLSLRAVQAKVLGLKDIISFPR